MSIYRSAPTSAAPHAHTPREKLRRALWRIHIWLWGRFAERNHRCWDCGGVMSNNIKSVLDHRCAFHTEGQL